MLIREKTFNFYVSISNVKEWPNNVPEETTISNVKEQPNNVPGETSKVSSPTTKTSLHKNNYLFMLQQAT
jgi:hypothetical protein